MLPYPSLQIAWSIAISTDIVAMPSKKPPGMGTFLGPLSTFYKVQLAISQLLGLVMINVSSIMFHSTIICGGISMTCRPPHDMR